MPLFNCSKCNCVENTACGDYWMRKDDDEPVLCSECSTGTWHGEFPKASAVGYLVGSDGFLWNKPQVAADLLPRHIKIVGEIAEDGSVRPTTSPERSE